MTDLAQRRDGSFVLVHLDSVYDLNVNTGELAHRFTDTTVAGHDGRAPDFAGVAPMLDPNAILTYDVTYDDDLWSYDEVDSYNRTLVEQHMIPGYNAGRGDLAGIVVPEPASAMLLGAAGLVLVRRRR